MSLLTSNYYCYETCNVHFMPLIARKRRSKATKRDTKELFFPLDATEKKSFSSETYKDTMLESVSCKNMGNLSGALAGRSSLNYNLLSKL